MGFMEGLNKTEVLEKVSKRAPEAFMGGCVFWPLVNVFNFTFIPATARVPYLATAGAFWNTFLSWLNNRGELAERLARESERGVRAEGEEMRSKQDEGPNRAAAAA
jgi:hypothetical protein